LTASAHDRSVFYDRWWHTGERDVDWHFDLNFPATDNWRIRVKDGASEWNALNESMSFDFVSGDISNVDFYDCPSTLHRDVIFREQIGDGSGGILAQTRSCAFNGDNTRIKTFNVRFDKAEDWYTGTGTPSTPTDLWGAATHEFGHATGFGLGQAATHFSSADCDSSPKQTMCPGVPSGYVLLSLEFHDKHTFRDRY
jgi:hypothetical protein